jgi:hypothetical protein
VLVLLVLLVLLLGLVLGLVLLVMGLLHGCAFRGCSCSAGSVQPGQH